MNRHLLATLIVMALSLAAICLSLGNARAFMRQYGAVYPCVLQPQDPTAPSNQKDAGLVQAHNTFNGNQIIACRMLVGDLVVDSSGSVFVSGHIINPDWSNAAKRTNNESNWHEKAFVAKIKDGGKADWIVDWVVSTDGHVFLEGPAMAMKGQVLYLSGTVAGDSIPLPDENTVSAKMIGGSDCFVTKLTCEGQLEWIKTWGGPGEDTADAIDLDQTGLMYIGGSGADPDTGSSSTSLVQATYPQPCVWKLSQDGILLWTRAGRWAGDVVDLKVDIQGNACSFGVVHVSHASDQLRGSNVREFPVSQQSCVFLWSLNSSGEGQTYQEWAQSGLLYPSDILLVRPGVVVLSGTSIGPVQFGSQLRNSDLILANASSFFIAEINSEGQYLDGFCVPTNKCSLECSSAVDGPGMIYMTGQFTGWPSPSFCPNASDDLASRSDVGKLEKNVFLFKANSQGQCEWFRKWGDGSADLGARVCIDSHGLAYVASTFLGCLDVRSYTSDGKIEWEFGSSGT